MAATEDRARRLARNQTLFREVNERLQELNAAFNDVRPAGDWICECANDSCAAGIELRPAEYGAIRSDPRRFPVAPDESHVFLDVERVAERNERYWVVEKLGVGAEVAETANPRDD